VAGLASVPRDPDSGRYAGRVANDTNYETALDAGTEAAHLHRVVIVWCLVFPSTAEAAISIRDTWGSHCNRILFFHQQQQDSEIPVARLPARSAWGLLCRALLEVSEAGPDQPDWVLITTEDTFALPENLRYYVAPLNASEPHYLGHAMKFWSQVYNWGSAGYAISRGALTSLRSRFSTGTQCDAGGKYWRNADWYLGKHLASLGIRPRDTRDHLGKGRFNGYSFKKLLFPGAVSLFERYWKDSLYLSPDGPACCSSHAITFHGILSKSKMYQLEYLFYHLRPFPAGGQLGNVPPPAPPAPLFLSEEERLKAAALDKWFQSQLLTTPKDMQLHIAQDYKE